MQGSQMEPVVSIENIMNYITEVEKHFNELTVIQRKVGLDEIDHHEAERK
jgi:hypothetical protein